MRYLLDVNALLAMALVDHELHHRIIDWMRPRGRGEKLAVATCAITELGFLRILCQPVHGYTVEEARTMLGSLKAISDLDFVFIADDLQGGDLPKWVGGSQQITDGHLVRLAEKHRATLATLDQRIPGAFLVPNRSTVR